MEFFWRYSRQRSQKTHRPIKEPMIKRVTDPKEFEKCITELSDLFDLENTNQGHHFLKHDKEHIINAFSHPQLLAWDFFTWVNINKEGRYDANIAFINNKYASCYRSCLCEKKRIQIRYDVCRS